MNKNNKIRMLHLVQGLGVGGAEVLLTQYIKALPEDKYIHFVYYFGEDGPIKDRLNALNVRIYSGKKIVSISNLITFTKKLIALIRDLIFFVKANEIQIIQSHLQRPNQLAVLIGKITNIPAFPTVHNTMAFVDRRPKWDIRVYIMKLIDEVIYRVADTIVAISDEVKEIIKNEYKIKDSKIVVLKNGIAFEKKDENLEYLNQEFEVPKNKLKILLVGRLTYQKAFEVFIKAANEMIMLGFKNFKVMLVGEGEEREKLEKMIKEKNLEKHIILLGIRNDVISLMKWSDVFIMPSRYEGLSIAMIEAMACGLPIIASNAPGIIKYIKNNYNGLLFPVENHKMLSKKIIEISQNIQLRKKLSLRAKNTFESNYNIYSNISTIKDLIEKSI